MRHRQPVKRGHDSKFMLVDMEFNMEIYEYSVDCLLGTFILTQSFTTYLRGPGDWLRDHPPNFSMAARNYASIS